jgi:hypothetical protein
MQQVVLMVRVIASPSYMARECGRERALPSRFQALARISGRKPVGSSDSIWHIARGRQASAH